jgi:hypothetical protein
VIRNVGTAALLLAHAFIGVVAERDRSSHG